MDKLLRPSIPKRVLAYILDFIILGIIGYLSGLFLEEFYVSLGKYGTLIGSSIAIIYFTVLNSKINRGQTVGKLAIDAKVTDLKGNYLPLEKSFLRAFILLFPLMNLELFSGGKGMMPILVFALIIIFSSLYFMLVNISRRTLHDILLSTVVSYHHVADFEVNPLHDRSQKKLIPIIGIAALIIGMGVYQQSTQNNLSHLIAAKEKVETLDGILTVNELKINTTYSSGAEPYSYVSLAVRLDNKEEAMNLESKYFKDIYEIIQSEIPDSQNLAGAAIRLYYGYNIGIASKTYGVSKTIKN